MSVYEFVTNALEGLESDRWRVGIGSAAHMMQQRDACFEQLNRRA